MTVKSNSNGIKYVFVCDPQECDTLVEITCVDGSNFPKSEIENKCPCGRTMAYISATVMPLDQSTKEEELQTVASLKSQIERLTSRNETLGKRDSISFKREELLRDLIEKAHSKSSSKEILSQIADIFDFSL